MGERVDPGLRVRGVGKAYGAVAVLRGVDLEVPAGSVTALLGPSGCGKTTLLRIVAGFETADTGAVAVAGVVVDGEGVRLAPERRRVGIVPQEGALFPHLDVRANIGFGLGRAAPGREGRVDELLAALGLPGLGQRRPHELSGGQQQRVAVARALAPRPALVLLDEPFASLDASLRGRVRDEVLAALRAAGSTTLLVTHDQDEALSCADELAVMNDGVIVQAGSPEEVYERPASPWVAQFVGTATLLPAHAAGAVAETPLGMLALAEPAHGVGTVMLRPEHLVLVAPGEPRQSEGAAEGVICAREYRGAEAMVTVAVAGRSLAVLTEGRLAPRPGEPAAVRVARPAWFMAD
jgi:iron(III) transport system ATP-binding protein